jgi:hypothetical protein
MEQVVSSSHGGILLVKLYIFVLGCLTLIAGTAQAITINTTDVGLYSNDQLGSAVFQNFNDTAIPTFTTVSVDDGANYNVNTIDWSISGGQTILSLDMNQRRTGRVYSYDRTNYNQLLFTANVSEPYQLSGYYSATDSGASGHLRLYARLTDQTAGVDLFWNKQESLVTTNEQFVLGGTGGDFANTLVGSLTGNVIAGHQYVFSLDCITEAYPQADSGASAVGNLTLKLSGKPGDFNGDNKVDAADYVEWRHRAGTASEYDLWRSKFGTTYSAGSGTSIDGASVPEPSTLVLCLAGIVATLMRRNRGR